MHTLLSQLVLLWLLARDESWLLERFRADANNVFTSHGSLA